MITYDQLWDAMQRSYPDLKVGVDYVIGFRVDPANPHVQTEDAAIVNWTPTDVAQPTQAALNGLCDFHSGTFTAQQQAIDVRVKRNTLLAAADALIEQTSDKAYELALRKYRKALRDVPDQTGFPATVEWPLLPTENK